MILLSSGASHEVNLILAFSLSVVLLGLLMRRLGQPYIVGYILTGVALGPAGLGIFTDLAATERMGELGLILLMFFIGLEINIRDFVRRWRVAAIGTGLQVALSVVLLGAVAALLEWPLNRGILLGLIVSLSSSAVVLKLSESLTAPDEQRLRGDIISILLTQDVAFVPMLVAISLLGGTAPDFTAIAQQALGGVLVIVVIAYLLRGGTFRMPFSSKIVGDHELQVFAALVVCFGTALATSLFGLSPGLGALVAGMVVHATPSGAWLHDTLHPFRVVLVSLFFVSVGLLIDPTFLVDQYLVVLSVLGFVFVVNTLINGLSLRVLGNTNAHSALGGAYLAQIGELSFVLASAGRASGMISSYGYQLTVAVIAISILLSPLWVLLISAFTQRRQKAVRGHVRG